MAVLKRQRANGTWEYVQQAGIDLAYFVQSSVPPPGAVEGTLWVDTSDETYQGTIFVDLENQITTHQEESKTDAHNIGNITGLQQELDSTDQDLDFQKALIDDDYNYNVISKDADDNITEINYTRTDDTLFRKVEASNPDADGNYQTLTMTEYESNGTTIKETREKQLTYIDGRVEERTKWVVV